MTFRDFLHRKSSAEHEKGSEEADNLSNLNEFVFFTTDTNHEEESTLPNENNQYENIQSSSPEQTKPTRSLFGSRRHKTDKPAVKEISKEGHVEDKVKENGHDETAGKKTQRSLSTRLSRLKISRSVSHDSATYITALSLPHAPDPIPAPLSPGLLNPTRAVSGDEKALLTVKNRNGDGEMDKILDSKRELEWEDYAARLALAPSPRESVNINIHDEVPKTSPTSAIKSRKSLRSLKPRSRHPSPIVTTIPPLPSNLTFHRKEEGSLQSQTPTPTPTSLFFPATSSSHLQLRAVTSPVHSRPTTPITFPNTPSTPLMTDEEEEAALLQEAIRLHESNALIRSTQLFKHLADPPPPILSLPGDDTRPDKKKSGNVMAQVMYGLALRHGWGCEKDEAHGLDWLRIAARGSAGGLLPLLHLTTPTVPFSSSSEKENTDPTETIPLDSSTKLQMTNIKNELVLAIFELANCYRYGWGTPKDPPTARTYYEAAANLKDVDALEEVGWCYLEGFGGKKDKVSPFPTLPLQSVSVR